MAEASDYPPIGDYALISDSNSSALVSREGSVDWCCMKRVDAGSCFGRLLDWERGGYCSIVPEQGLLLTSRRYLEDTLVLETTLRTPGGEARILDCFTMPASMEEYPYRQLLRIVEGVSGHVGVKFEIVPRFDYGGLKPWIRHQGVRRYGVIGGDDALIVSGDAEISQAGNHELEASASVRAGERVRLSLISVPPERMDYDTPEQLGADDLDLRLRQTAQWWRDWSSRLAFEGDHRPGVSRSALTLKALTNAKTGAVAAAPTTSLPERPGGELNWDYRYSWIRDSFFSVRALAEIGFVAEANGFRRFIERSAAGSAEELQIMYGVGGERRLTEETLPHLEGYRGASPVRVGNAASGQLQLDMYGELLELSWRWHRRGNSPDDDYWRFLLELVDAAARNWRKPDCGLWEIRDDPRHFVHSKVLCWVALDRGARLSEECLRRAPVEKWTRTRDEIRQTVESRGYDSGRGVFVRDLDGKDLDAALLLLPRVGFVDYADERMVRTTDAIREDLDDDGLIKRYRKDEAEEGAFLACSFWLAECLAYQDRIEDARRVFDRAVEAGNDLGLLSEEYDTEHSEPLGNFPQGLSHLSHITAALVLAGARGGG